MGHSMKGRVLIDIAGNNGLLVQVTLFRSIDEFGQPVADSFITTELQPIKKAIAAVCKQGKDTVQEIPEELNTNIVKPPDLKVPEEGKEETCS